MPFRWDENSNEAPDQTGAFCFGDGSAPRARMTLWAHRSMSNAGFAWFIGVTFAMFLLPLIALLGSLALWGLLPFLMISLWAVWYFLRRSDRDRSLHEILCLWDDRVELMHHHPRKGVLMWDANPHWVNLRMDDKGGPVENYVTMRGGGRTVEIGAFLSPEERECLFRSLQTRFG